MPHKLVQFLHLFISIQLNIIWLFIILSTLTKTDCKFDIFLHLFVNYRGFSQEYLNITHHKLQIKSLITKKIASILSFNQ